MPDNDRYVDDAVHIEAFADANRTLCDQVRWGVGRIVSFAAARPDAGSGCWTCLQRAEKIDAGLRAWMDAR